MAQVIITDQQVISTSWREWGRTIGFGAATGLIFWLLTVLLQRYVVDPLVCRQLINATLCANSTPLAGNIAAILTAAIAVVFLVRAQIARPIILAVATAALLWDLALWTNGLFWLEAVVWSVVLYALCYALFAWITRYATLWVTVVLSLLIIVIIRIALVL